MSLRTVLTTTLLAGTLLFPAPGPEAQPRQVRPTPAQTCAAFGRFAHNRALDRDKGIPYEVMRQRSRAYDAASGADVATLDYHENILAWVYRFPNLTPTQHEEGQIAWCHQAATNDLNPTAGMRR